MNYIFRHAAGTCAFVWTVSCIADMKGLKGREKITYIFEFFCRILIASAFSQLLK